MRKTQIGKGLVGWLVMMMMVKVKVQKAAEATVKKQRIFSSL